MLPHSWKCEIKESVEEATNTDREQRETAQNNAAANIAATIKTLSDAQNTQTTHEDRNQKINATLSGITIFFVFLTVIFTGLSWSAFRDQLHIFSEQLDEMKKAYKPIEAQSKAASEATKIASDTLVAANRAWISPIGMGFDGVVEIGKEVEIYVLYGNTGKEPARDINVIAHDYFTKPPGSTEGWDNIIVQKNVMCTQIYPSTPNTFRHSFRIEKDWINADVQNIVLAWYVQGCFIYRTFNQIKESAFCFFLYPRQGRPMNQWIWRVCSGGNHAT
jgi:hypothetical protein